jgi:hypothetical protein
MGSGYCLLPPAEFADSVGVVDDADEFVRLA